jgi:hypothetical protein
MANGYVNGEKLPVATHKRMRRMPNHDLGYEERQILHELREVVSGDAQQMKLEQNQRGCRLTLLLIIYSLSSDVCLVNGGCKHGENLKTITDFSLRCGCIRTHHSLCSFANDRTLPIYALDNEMKRRCTSNSPNAEGLLSTEVKWEREEGHEKGMDVARQGRKDESIALVMVGWRAKLSRNT